MLSVADAARTVMERVPRLGTESIALDAALGHILATDIVAGRALPGFDNSAMDGYALRAADIPGALPIAGIVAAGSVRAEPVPPRSCVRIYTGAPLPADLDTVVMQEDVTVDGSVVTFPAAKRGDHVRRAGEDVAIGDTVLTAGTRIVPWHVGLLAALGVARVPVRRRPRVAIIATGDELVEVDTAPGPGQLVSSSTHALVALITECGGEAHALGIARDDVDEIRAMIAHALGEDGVISASSYASASSHAGVSTATSHASTSGAFDVVITTGGVSVGDRDHVHTALEAAGVTRELYKVAMKPGKPFAFGTRHAPIDDRASGGSPASGDTRVSGDSLASGDTRASSDTHVSGGTPGTPVFGLPGNPVSTLVAFELFVRPAILAMQSAAIVDRPRVPVQLATVYRKQAGRAHYLRAAITREGEHLVAHAAAKQGSAMQSSLVGSSALVEIPADATEIAEGALVTAILLEAV